MGIFDRLASMGNSREMALAQTVLDSSSSYERQAMTYDIRDKNILAQLLSKTDDDNLAQFMPRLKGRDDLLEKVAINSPSPKIGHEAVVFISDDNVKVLNNVANNARKNSVRHEAKMKLH